MNKLEVWPLQANSTTPMSSCTSRLTRSVSPCRRGLHPRSSDTTRTCITTTMNMSSATSSPTVSHANFNHLCLLREGGWGVGGRSMLGHDRGADVCMVIPSASASRQAPLHRQGLEGPEGSGRRSHGGQDVCSVLEVGTPPQRLQV